MTTVGWKIVFLSFAMYASAQMANECGTPLVHQYATLDKKFLSIQKFGQGEKVYYVCAEGYTPSKGSRAVQCDNGKWSPLTLKCEKKSCGNAGELPNGQFLYEGNSVVGDKVTAECNDGYTLKGMKYMICKASGWTGEFPSCEEAGAMVPVQTTCSNPAVANSVTHNGGAPVHRVGSTVIFTCNQGFKLDGSQQVTCGPGGQWQPQLPQCLPSNDVTCVAPKAQLRNKYTVIGGLKPLYKHGDTLSFFCNEPYRLNGSATATCGLSGRWTPRLPKCTWAQCPELKIPHSRLSSKHKRVNSVIIVSCHRGYYQKGPSKIACLKDGKWSATPECVSRNWAETTCSNPVVANAVRSTGYAAVHRVGDSVTFTCNQGFQLTGSQQVTCSPGGQWQPQPPLCLHPRENSRCGVPVDHGNSNSHLADPYSRMKSFTNGDKVRYMCDIGYAQVGGSRYRRCYDGKWTSLLINCERKMCGSAGEVLNGQFMYTGSQFGDTATAHCDEGFELVGRGTRTCRSDGWDGRVAICDAVQCEEPPAVTNAETTGTLAPPYMYTSVVGYRCRGGTLIGQREIWCTKDGTWSAPPPKCQEITCPFPNVPNCSWAGARRVAYTYRDTVSFECDWGYEMSGPSIVTCGADGQWSPGLPRCHYRGTY